MSEMKYLRGYFERQPYKNWKLLYFHISLKKTTNTLNLLLVVVILMMVLVLVVVLLSLLLMINDNDVGGDDVDAA